MKTLVFALFLLLTTAQIATAQLHLALCPELGYAITVRPRGNTLPNPRGYQKQTVHNLFNPLLGFNARLLLGKHWQLSASLQYQLTGDAHHYHLNVRDSQGYTHLHDEYYSQRYHKICLPVMAGYSFKIGKLRPFLTLGYRLGYMVYGLEKYAYYFVTTRPGGYHSLHAGEWHPLQIPHDQQIPWRRLGQVVCSVGTEIGNHLHVGINLASGGWRSYTNIDESMMGGYHNNDLYFVMAWRIWERAGKRVTIR